MYSISREVFLGAKPEVVMPYKVGNLVDRGNFTPYRIFSFRVSRGAPAAQKIVWEFTKAKSGFDFHTTYDNYLTSGGKRSLSEDEANMILKAYITSGHNGVYPKPFDVTKEPRAFRELILNAYDLQIGSTLYKAPLYEEEIRRLKAGDMREMLVLAKVRIANLRRTS